MRGTLAKALRRAAKRIYEMQAEKPKKSYSELVDRRRYSKTPKFSPDGEPVFEEDGVTQEVDKRLLAIGTVILEPRCERAIYQRVKTRAKIINRIQRGFVRREAAQVK